MEKQEMLELLEELERYGYYKDNSNFKLISKLLRGIEENDPDLQAVPSNYMLECIIELFVDVYTSEGLISWLDAHDYDVLDGIRFAEWYEYDEIDAEDLDDMKENALINDEDNEVMLYSW